MRAGTLNKRITIQTYEEQRDSYGEPIKQFNDLLKVWAAVEPIKGQEFYAAQQVQSSADVRIRVRWRDDLIDYGTRLRLVYGSHAYDVQQVIPINYVRREIHFMCTERFQHGFRS